MADTAYGLIDGVFKALGRGDKEAAIAAFADDASIFDPHYPQPLMRGKAAIRAGLDWGFGSMKSFGFDTKHYFPGKDGLSGVFEVDTHHVLKIGKKLDFPQVFVVETDADQHPRGAPEHRDQQCREHGDRVRAVGVGRHWNLRSSGRGRWTRSQLLEAFVP